MSQSPCWSLEYSIIVKLLTEHCLECLSLKGGCRGSSESTHVKMPHCWKSHSLAHIFYWFFYNCDLWKLNYRQNINNNLANLSLLYGTLDFAECQIYQFCLLPFKKHSAAAKTIRIYHGSWVWGFDRRFRPLDRCLM